MEQQVEHDVVGGLGLLTLNRPAALNALTPEMVAALAAARGALEQAGFAGVDYLALVDGESLKPIAEPREGARLIAAAVIGTTRLIDNIPLQSGSNSSL